MINPSTVQLRPFGPSLRRTHSSIPIPTLATTSYAIIRGTVFILVFLIALHSAAFAQSGSLPASLWQSSYSGGTLTQYLTTWGGLQRMYYIYIPRTLASAPSIVVFLHASYPKTAIPLYELPPWATLANEYGFVMLLPISTWDPSIDTWRWDCDGCESGFAVPPDDSGFIRSAILATQAQYKVGPGQTFVAGMSSGAYMTQRVGMEQSDIIAAIAPVAGAQYIQPLGTTFDAPFVSNPISVYRLHGDLDTVVPYCGGVKGFWDKIKAYSPSADSDIDFWSGEYANDCTAASESDTLCTNSVPTVNVTGQDESGCKGGVEVIFEREVGVGHTWVKGTEAKLWAFFQTHGR